MNPENEKPADLQAKQLPELTKTELEMWKKTVFEQRWLHARHAETLRSAMASVYAVILSGSIAALKENFLTKQANLLHVLLMTLSLILIGFSIKCAEVFEAHTKAADKLLPEALRIFPLFPKKTWENSISVKGLFLLFFFICLAGLLSVFLWTRFGT
jgi:hypothetical protein